MVKQSVPLSDEKYFFCPEEVVVPAGGTAQIDVTYFPLTMTGDSSDEQNSRPIVHQGSVFIPTPDGNAFLINLEVFC